MDPVLEQYIKLTEIDALLHSVAQQLEGYPRMIAAMDAAEGDQRRAIEKAKADAAEAQRRRRDAEKEIAAQREKIRKYTSQQGGVKTNKEYEALSGEIDRTKGEIDAWETKGLELLVAEEEAGEAGERAQGRLRHLQAEHAAERTRIEEQIADKKNRLERLTSERARAAADVEPDALENYESAQARTPGSACMPLQGDNCPGCGWLAVPHVRQAVLAGKLVKCEHCRRYLFHK